MIRQGNVRERRREEMHQLYCRADGRNGYRDRSGGDVRKQFEPGPFNWYALTQTDGSADALAQVVNKDSTNPMFAGMISKVIIGGTGNQNPYGNIHKVLDALNIKMDRNEINHNSHFHIYLAPPTAKEIGSKKLLADMPLALASDTSSSDTSLQTAAQGLLDYTSTLITGEELMFTMDVPSVPAQQTPVVIAQAATPASPQSDYILKACQESINYSDAAVFDGIGIAGEIKNYIQNRDNRPVKLDSIKNITQLEATKHGKITSEGVYIPERGYLGNDRATFMAEFEGKRYKVIVDIHVVTYIDPGTDYPTTTCPPPKLIKVNGKPVSGSIDYNLGNITVTFADLTGGALGQTTGNSIIKGARLEIVSGAAIFLPTPIASCNDRYNH
jgi:hypothetical protein